MARVFVGDELGSGRRVAIKVLPFSLAESSAVGRFRRELELAQRLRHEHIVPVLHADQTGELLYYVMPFAGDSTLRNLMDARRQLPLAEVLTLTNGIASALTYAHVQNVVHRDIKPENILLDGGRALVADFGIARAIERVATVTSVTTTGLTLGTPRYMSPEQAAASRDIDGRSDIYSLGCVVFEMLAGEPPFVSSDPRTLVAKHINDPAPSVLSARPDLPEHVDQAIRCALAKAPVDRFATADAFAAALRTPGSVPLVQRESGSAARTKSARWRSLALSAAGVAGLALVALFAFPSRESAPPASGPVRVAVLNFQADEPDSSLAVFGRAITADLIDLIRRSPGFIPLTHAAIRSVPVNAALDSLGQRLGVQTFVVGELERRGDSVRVTARIVNAETLTELGPAPIRAQFAAAALMQLRDTVIQEVGRRLLTAFGQEARLQQWRTGTRSARAWELRQRAQDLLDHSGDLPEPRAGFAPQLAALSRADSLLRAASEADPSWSDPYVTRGWILSRRTVYEGVARAAVLYAAAESLANVALALRADDAAALELRGNARIGLSSSVSGASTSLRDSAEQDLRAALRLDRERTRAWQSLASLLSARGDTAGAATAAQRAAESDPYSLDLSSTMSTAVTRHQFAGRADSARIACQRARAVFPHNSVVRMCTLNVLGWVGAGPVDLARAREELAWHEQSGPIPLTAGMYVVGRFWIAAIQARSRSGDSARAAIAEIRARLREAGMADTALVNEAHVLTELGEHGGAVTLLERHLAANPNDRESLGRHPWFDALRAEPRFRALFPAR